MKNWKNAEIVEISIKETASGDFHAGFESSFFDTHDAEHCSENRSGIGAIIQDTINWGGDCHGVATNATEGNS